MKHRLLPILSPFLLLAAALPLLAAETDLAGFEPLPDAVADPEDNPSTPAKVALGKQLYFDPRLSVNGTVSCNGCHDAMLSGTTNLPVPFGVYGRIDGDRNDPTVWNAAFKSAQFWDGRAPTLEEQAKGPLFNEVEMGMPDHETLVERVRGIPGYRQQFAKVFGGEKPVTVDHIVQAIAAYERTLITPNGPFDRYLKGDERALSAQAVAGAKLVQSLGCTTCHNGPNLSGPQVPGGFFQKFPEHTDNPYVERFDLKKDLGKYDATKKDGDQHLWIVQSLRNIELTAPYFHNGSVADLDTAVRVMAKTQLDEDLSEPQVQKVRAFLATLTGPFPEQTLPRLPATPGTTPLMGYETPPSK